MQTVILFLIFASVVFCCVYFTRKKKQPAGEKYIPDDVNVPLNEFEEDLLKLINNHRRDLNLKELKPEKLASEICRNQIEIDVEKKTYGTHAGWERRVEESRAAYGSEILGNYFISSFALFSAYMQSPKHKASIENPDRTHIGIGFIHKRNYCLILKYK